VTDVSQALAPFASASPAWSSSGRLDYGGAGHRIGAWRRGQTARTLPTQVAKFVSIVAG